MGLLLSCFISDPGVFFGAFLGPIFLITLFNIVIFFYAGFVITSLKLKQERMKKAAHQNKAQKGQISSKEVSKLLISVAGFMVLLGLPWIVMVFMVVGVATNIYAAFAIQLLFVLFNSFQGFFFCINQLWCKRGLILARYKGKAKTRYSAKHSLPSTDKDSQVTYKKVVNTASAQANDESMFVDDALVFDDNVETDAQLPSLFNANEETFEDQENARSNNPEMHSKEEHSTVNHLSWNLYITSDCKNINY